MGTSTATTVVPFWLPRIEITAKRYPRKRLPESPRKILAGRKFQRRKPSRLPTRATLTASTPRWPRNEALTATATVVISAIPAASPSSPSMRFTALVMPTIHSTVMGRESRSNSTTWLLRGRGTHVDPEAGRPGGHRGRDLSHELPAERDSADVVQEPQQEHRAGGDGQHGGGLRELAAVRPPPTGRTPAPAPPRRRPRPLRCAAWGPRGPCAGRGDPRRPGRARDGSPIGSPPRRSPPR